jgi:hypothetical protein
MHTAPERGRRTSRNTNDEDLMNLTRFSALLALLLLAVTLSHPAAAQHRRGVANQADCTLTNTGRKICGGGSGAARTMRTVDANGTPVVRASGRSDGTIIGGRPAGCPHRYCGCGLRKHLGIADKRLNLASNWARLFPRASGPGPGIAAVRGGHVMYIERATGDGRWVVRDYNSGGGLSRIHVRSVRGYTFVNPHTRLAQR